MRTPLKVFRFFPAAALIAYSFYEVSVGLLRLSKRARFKMHEDCQGK